MIPNPASVQNPVARQFLSAVLIFGPLYLLSSVGVPWAFPIALGVLMMIVLIRYQHAKPWSTP